MAAHEGARHRPVLWRRPVTNTVGTWRWPRPTILKKTQQRHSERAGRAAGAAPHPRYAGASTEALQNPLHRWRRRPRAHPRHAARSVRATSAKRVGQSERAHFRLLRYGRGHLNRRHPDLPAPPAGRRRPPQIYGTGYCRLLHHQDGHGFPEDHIGEGAFYLRHSLPDDSPRLTPFACRCTACGAGTALPTRLPTGSRCCRCGFWVVPIARIVAQPCLTAAIRRRRQAVATPQALPDYFV